MQSERVRELAQLMGSLDLECVAILHSGLHSFLETNPVYTVSGFRGMGEHLLLVRMDGSSLLVVTPRWDKERAGRSGPTRALGCEDLRECLAQLPELAGCPAERIGFVGLRSMRPQLAAVVREQLAPAPRLVDEAFHRRFQAKTPDEITAARRATEIAERTYDRMLALVRPGVREYEVAAELEAVAKSLGADDLFLMLTASQHNRAITSASDRVLERGDIVLVELSPSVLGQYTQICRTIYIGEPSPAARENYRLLAAAFESGLAAVRPGETAAGVAAAVNRPLEAAGYGQYCRPPFIRVRGHSLGLGPLAPGDIATDNPAVLEEGMVFVLHPNQYLPEAGYMMCGDPVLVTAQGGRSLARALPSLGSAY